MRLPSVVFLLFSALGAGQAQVGEISLSFGESLFKNNKIGFADAVTQYQTIARRRKDHEALVDGIAPGPVHVDGLTLIEVAGAGAGLLARTPPATGTRIAGAAPSGRQTGERQLPPARTRQIIIEQQRRVQKSNRKVVRPTVS